MIKARESFKTFEKFAGKKVNLKYQMCRAGTDDDSGKTIALIYMSINFLASPTQSDIGS